MITHQVTPRVLRSFQNSRNNVGKKETQTPRGKTLNGGRFRGVSFIQTLFVFIVGETYLRLG